MPPDTMLIPNGSFIMGSDAQEREAAYQLDEKAYGHSVTRTGQWYGGEFKRHRVTIPSFAITKTPITNRQYAIFVQDTGHAYPTVSQKTWTGYGLAHPFSQTLKYSWTSSIQPPQGSKDHPVVLVSHGDATAYAKWLSQKTGKKWRLPQETEWEKSVRGLDGWWFPWGNQFDGNRLNSHDQGPFATTVVTAHENGAGPFGLMDGSGQVYEWTNTVGGTGRFIVKGGSWDDKGCGVCRPAARHSRPQHLKHILIGFRLVRETN